MGCRPGEIVDMTTAIDPETIRKVRGLRIVEYHIPQSCCASYYPEANPLFPWSHHDPKAKTPSYKLLPIRLSTSEGVPVERRERCREVDPGRGQRDRSMPRPLMGILIFLGCFNRGTNGDELWQ